MYRPYPPPSDRPWILSMKWEELLFAHWPVDPLSIRPLLPRDLELDLWDGKAWLGIVPFRMVGTRPRFCPPISAISDFPELNVRTYVVRNGKPGVWFFSLDAGSKVAVRAAKYTFHLPYFDARFEIEHRNNETKYRASRTHIGAPSAQLDINYKAIAQVETTRHDSFEYWLTGRFCLYSADREGRIFCGEIDHKPWPLQRAEAEIRVCDMTRLLKLELKGAPASLLYSKSLDVVAWPIK